MLLRKKEEIEDWLNQYEIRNYEMIEDHKYGYVVNINRSVDLYNKKLKNIEVKFNKINGDFACSDNELKSLEGCPEIVNGYFFCNNNKLITLEGCPEIVKGDFTCNQNKLTTLKGCPKIIEGSFSCVNNQLKTLEGCPKIVNGYFYCYDNFLNIESLKYLPEIVTENFVSLKNNQELNYLQSINKFNELKEKVEHLFKIKKEKENILKVLKIEDLIINNKVNKI